MLKTTAFLAALGLLAGTAEAEDKTMILSPDWEYVADTVMGGVSQGRITAETLEGRAATRLTGAVSLENNGGFVQMAFDVADAKPGEWTGIEMRLRGNGEIYDLRLRTEDLTRPWQSFRTEFEAPPEWTMLRIPFTALVPHRTQATFAPERLRRIGIVAIGRVFDADIAIAEIGFYRKRSTR